MVTLREIQDLADGITCEFHPERIILFGSYARGEPTPDSDVDLLVVVPYNGKCWEMASRIRGHFRPGFPLDLVVRSPAELRRRVAMGDVFLRDVCDRGTVLYEANHG